jgi:Arm DNA-binding domain
MHWDSNRLTALKVVKLNKPGRYGDGGGLVLQVSKWGTKAWPFRYERDGRERQMGLGPLGTISLAEARQRALQARKLLLDGLDPIAVRNEHRRLRGSRLREASRSRAAQTNTLPDIKPAGATRNIVRNGEQRSLNMLPDHRRAARLSRRHDARHKNC